MPGDRIQAAHSQPDLTGGSEVWVEVFGLWHGDTRHLGTDEEGCPVNRSLAPAQRRPSLVWNVPWAESKRLAWEHVALRQLS